MTKEQIIEAVKSMTVLELNDLVKAIEEEFGVTALPVPAENALHVHLRRDDHEHPDDERQQQAETPFAEHLRG